MCHFIFCWLSKKLRTKGHLLKQPGWMMKFLFQHKSKFSVSGHCLLVCIIDSNGFNKKKRGKNTVRTDWMYLCLWKLPNQKLYDKHLLISCSSGLKVQSVEPIIYARRFVQPSHEMTVPCLLRCTSGKHPSNMFVSIQPLSRVDAGVRPPDQPCFRQNHFLKLARVSTEQSQFLYIIDRYHFLHI